MRTLPVGLRREVTALSFLYRWTIPNCFLPSSATQYEDFDAELTHLRSLRADVAASELLRPVYDHGGRAQRRILADPTVRAVALKRAGTLGSGARRAAALLFDDPRELVERLARLLEAYW